MSYRGDRRDAQTFTNSTSRYSESICDVVMGIGRYYRYLIVISEKKIIRIGGPTFSFIIRLILEKFIHFYE